MFRETIMKTDDIEIDTLLQEHFHTELDGLSGRAEQFFMNQTATEASPRRIQVGHWKIRTAVTCGAIAAMLCVVSGLSAFFQGRVTRHPVPALLTATIHPNQKPALREIPYERAIAYRTIDAGPVRTKDSVPTRALRREVVQTIRWYDPEHREQMQVTVPSEQVVYVKMPAY